MKARFEVEIEPSNWHPVIVTTQIEAANAAIVALRLIGVEAMLSCECGAYPFGECEQCEEDSDATVP